LLENKAIAIPFVSLILATGGAQYADAPEATSVFGTGAMLLAGRVVWRAVQNIAEHGERLKAIETKIETLTAEVKHVREDRHELARKVGEAFIRLDVLERGKRDDRETKSSA
jgi:hypothetical protein